MCKKDLEQFEFRLNTLVWLWVMHKLTYKKINEAFYRLQALFFFFMPLILGVKQEIQIFDDNQLFFPKKKKQNHINECRKETTADVSKTNTCHGFCSFAFCCLLLLSLWSIHDVKLRQGSFSHLDPNCKYNRHNI